MAHAASSRPSSPRSWRTGYAACLFAPAPGGGGRLAQGREGIWAETPSAECLAALGRGTQRRDVGHRFTKRALLSKTWYLEEEE